ncbi:prepilin peptidase [Patescibacteria group bacterium]|nr:prepilin peptidase [Patescibacteria group bacterium]MCL5091598.1 prepilin peptidase [Patescibacteria group bacterium]
MIDERGLWSLIIFVTGTVIGSFLNVLIDRWPKNQSINGRSHCDYCHKTLAAGDLVPVLSFFWLRGRCHYCHKPLSWQYPLIELLTGLVMVLMFWFPFPLFGQVSASSRQTVGSWALMVAGSAVMISLIVIFVSDLKYQIIPDQIQVVFFTSALFYLLTRLGARLTLIDLIWQLMAGVMVTMPILLVYLFTKGKGMGFGDVKLAFNMGMLLGVKGGLLALYFAFVLGGVYASALFLAKKKKMKSRVAFGPFLVLGTVVMLWAGQHVLSLIRAWYGI